jgi:hypothetical protein
MSTVTYVPTTRPAAPSVRLTSRGRGVVLTALLGALVALGALVGHAATADAGARVPVRQVTVRPGETLWNLAARIAPGADPRVVVARLEAVNHLAGDEVAAGQRLVVSGVSGS